MKKSFLIIMFSLFASIAIADELAEPVRMMHRSQLAEYALSLDGLSKADLKNAVFALTKPMSVLSYGSGEGKTWWGFYSTDRVDENVCIDRYSNQTFNFSEKGKSIQGTNIEHSFPKSWWGGAEFNSYKDLYNLMPSESSINKSKSNFTMGIVENATNDNGCTKVGTGKNRTKYWEPADKWKGDFARVYFYMVSAHQNLSNLYVGEALNAVDNNIYPTLQEWASQLYLEWVRRDSVTQLEVERNNAVYYIQHNRNLFVDYPNLAEYIWGDSVNVAFHPATSVTSAPDDNRYSLFTLTKAGWHTAEGVDISNTLERPYTVSEARELIEKGEGLSATVFVKGFVCKKVKYDNGMFTYNISDDVSKTNSPLQCYRGLGLKSDPFENDSVLEIGSEVIVKGILKKYISWDNTVTFELDAGNELVRIESPTCIVSQVTNKISEKYNLSGQKARRGYKGIVLDSIGKKILCR